MDKNDKFNLKESIQFSANFDFTGSFEWSELRIKNKKFLSQYVKEWIYPGFETKNRDNPPSPTVVGRGGWLPGQWSLHMSWPAVTPSARLYQRLLQKYFRGNPNMV